LPYLSRYMNPCPCGYFGDPTRECTCSAGAIARYQKRISGPLLDRIDLHVEVSGPAASERVPSRAEQGSSRIFPGQRSVLTVATLNARGITIDRNDSVRLIQLLPPSDLVITKRGLVLLMWRGDRSHAPSKKP
jgi:predicted ATPase with chaperone activity